MEELDYLDQARLIAVDHPADVEVYPNERFASEPPFPKFKVIASSGRTAAGRRVGRSRAQYSAAARESAITSTSPISAQLPYAGFAPMHWIELDLGDWDPRESAAPADGRLDGLFQREFDVRGVASGHHADSAVRGSAGRFRQVGERDRRHGIPCRACRARWWRT